MFYICSFLPKCIDQDGRMGFVVVLLDGLLYKGSGVGLRMVLSLKWVAVGDSTECIVCSKPHFEKNLCFVLPFLFYGLNTFE